MKNSSPCPLHFSLHPLSLSYILVKCPKILILGFFLLLGSSLDISMILALDQSLRIQPIGSSRRLSREKNGQNRLATIFFLRCQYLRKTHVSQMGSHGFKMCL